MKKVYFISGLGADQRIFSLLDLSFCEPVFIDWIAPQKKESLQSYAIRLRQTIPEKTPVIVGISFGGMLAAEMAKADPGIKAILISSNKNSREFPFYLRVGKYIPVYKWIPGKWIPKWHAFYTRIFGVSGKTERELMKKIVADSDMHFVKWAIGSILHWNSKGGQADIIHIHGTADILLPYRFVKADHTVKGGKHVMPLDKHEEISILLRELIQGLNATETQKH